MNRYPLWKYLLIVLVLAVCSLYALPNLYPEDPAVQISYSKGPVGDDLEERLRKLLAGRNISFKQAERQAETMLLRFSSAEQQLEAASLIDAALDDNYVVALNLAPSTPAWLRAVDAKPMNLGLDLRGGVHFLFEVNMDAAVKQALARYEGDFRNLLREDKIRYLSVDSNPGGLTVKFRDAQDSSAGMKALSRQFDGELLLDEQQLVDQYVVTARFKETATKQIRDFALQQNITTLRNRVNELGVTEPIIAQQGINRIVVQLPGVQDTARAKEILGSVATLEFRLVDEQADPYSAKESGQAPSGDRLYQERNGNPILLKQRVMLTGDYIQDASSGIDQQTGRPAVYITLDGKGARLWSKVTGDNVQKLMAVVFITSKPDTVLVDGQVTRTKRNVEEVINVARIQEPLSKRFQITGLENTREARNLALLLRAGALAAPMDIIEERTIGPSLGQQNIERGIKSAALGFILVVVFMAIYYRLFGLVANLALLGNLVVLVGVMSMIPGATLTLPGIAGIVLTLGMAVDANVLINERIREELRNGVSPQAAIHAGYDKAFNTILDSNVTTLIAAVVLFAFGTGPIKGFAVTLALGIVTSMFTAIMGTRAVVNLLYGRKKQPVLSI